MISDRGRGPDMGSVGWMSVVDALVMGIVLVLGVCLLALGQLGTEIVKNKELQKKLDGIIPCPPPPPSPPGPDTLEALRRQVKLLETELARLKTELALVTDERDGLRGQVADLTKERNTLKVQVADLTKDRNELRVEVAALTKERNQLSAELVAARAEQKRLTTVLDTLKLENATLLADNTRLKTKLDETLNELAILKKKDEISRLARLQVNKELLGLKGDMRKVVVLFDKSGSMDEKVLNGRTRWVEAIDVVTTWVKNLSVDEAAVVLFSDEIEVFPAAGGFVPLTGKDADRNREQLLGAIRAAQPKGGTYTCKALEEAYKLNPDTVILFTDGEPSWEPGRGIPPPENNTKEGWSVAGAKMRPMILDLCRSKFGAGRRSPIPVNTVGLGKYYAEKPLTEFLLTLATDTGGVFLGR